MTNDHHLLSKGWDEYELLDSGDHMKLERFGTMVLARPETQALWPKTRPELWQDIHAEFVTKDGKGAWKTMKPVPESWTLSRGPIRFNARLGGFKHVGIFPEQEPNWMWIKDQALSLQEQQDPASLQQLAAKKSSDLLPPVGQTVFSQAPVPRPSVLNLFGYTGLATLAAAHAGALVTHVDASKQSLDVAHENARLSDIPPDRIRWMPDDALSFVKREVRRETKYDGIILDPPAFGRGAKGEVWKIEDDLYPLLVELKKIFKAEPGSFFLMNGYAAGYASRSFARVVESVFGSVDGESGELHLKESNNDRTLSSGIYTRFVV